MHFEVSPAVFWSLSCCNELKLTIKPFTDCTLRAIWSRCKILACKVPACRSARVLRGSSGTNGLNHLSMHNLEFLFFVWQRARFYKIMCSLPHQRNTTISSGIGPVTCYTCQVSRLSKAWLSHLWIKNFDLTRVLQFFMAGRKVCAIRALTDTFWKIH